MRRLSLFLNLALAPAALAQTPPSTQVSGWTVGPSFSEGRYVSCFAWRPAEAARPGGYNGLGLRADGAYYVNLQTPGWTLGPGATYPVTLVIGPITLNASGQAIRVDALSAAFTADPRTLEALRTASAVEVRGAAATFVAAYPSAAAAIDALQACAREHNPAARNPFAAPQAAAPVQPQAPAQPQAQAQPQAPAPRPASPPPTRGDLRSNPSEEQVRVVFAPLFPELRGMIVAPPDPAHPDETGMVGIMTGQNFQGAVGFLEKPNRGRPEEQLVRDFAQDERRTCPAATIRGNQPIMGSGVSFRRLAVTCPADQSPARRTEVLIVVGSQRHQIFYVIGADAQAADIERRALAAFDGIVASYN